MPVRRSDLRRADMIWKEVFHDAKDLFPFYAF